MAYKTDELREKALAAIKKYSLVFIEDVVSYLPCSKPTFYDHKLNESDDIKSALEKNRISDKVRMRKKWRDSDNATLQIAYYKMIATEEEFKRLTGQNVDHTSKGERMEAPPIVFYKPDTSEFEDWENEGNTD